MKSKLLHARITNSTFNQHKQTSNKRKQIKCRTAMEYKGLEFGVLDEEQIPGFSVVYNSLVKRVSVELDGRAVGTVQ